MDNEYTTVSKGKTVDGWLGFMVGTELWYPLWSLDNVQSTATELAKLIGNNAKRDGYGIISSVSPPSKTTMVASASSPTVAISSPTPTTTTTTTTTGPNYISAWALLHDPAKVISPLFPVFRV